MEERTLAETPWLSLREKVFHTRNGQEKKWSYVTRPNTGGGVCIIATTREAPRDVILVRQFRPALGQHVYEFPAGLLDDGETWEAAALRELQEETGYTGTIRTTGPLALSSPGLTDEGNVVIEVVITGQGEPAPEDEERIEVLRWPLAELFPRLQELACAGERIDAKLWCYALGRHAAQRDAT
ncbi:MAG: ADP-sugar pyrophosphatase [Puniceicoccaceae bacterium 5H]|nr:MAG: ADP-sugar pyrophosphatase [Puniceicoccaceae bacterium 5H]